MAWQPIATAPKDGTVIDVWLGNADESDAEFYCGKGTRRSPSWAWNNGKLRPCGGLSLPVFVEPTHWTPLPAAPVGEPAAMVGERWKCPRCADAWMQVTKPAKHPPICSCGGEMQKQSPAAMPPEMPEIQVGDTIAHGLPFEPLQFWPNVTEWARRRWQGDPNVVMVLRPIWRRTDRKEPTS